jgi:DNA-binding MarR family transcriptional regulator
MGMLKRNDNGEAAAAFYDKRRKWRELLVEHPDVGHATFRVGYWLSMKMNGEDQCTWWSVKRIAEHLRVSTRTVSDATAELERLGLMLVVRESGKRNTYFIRSPLD